MKNFLKYGIPIFTILLIGIIGYFIFSPGSGNSNSPIIASSSGCSIKFQPSIKRYAQVPTMCIDTKKEYDATIHTSMGTITLSLFPKSAPQSVNNFVFLSKSGFYNNLIFHRVIPNFVIQAGDPKGNGMGGPGYIFGDEINAVSLGLNKDEIASNVAAGYHYETSVTTPKITTAIVAEANSGPNTNGSQFFIALADQPNLDGRYTPFGTVTSGMDVANNIAAVDRDGSDKPYKKIVISSIDISEHS